MKGHLIIFSGPSGVGKDTLLEAWAARNPRVKKVTAYTTRAPRDGEVNGRDYHFVDRATFDQMAHDGAFLEFKEVYGNGYATPNQGVVDLLAEGALAILKIDVQGALDAMGKRPDALSIFILPPSTEELERRIRDRATDSDEQIKKRLDNALHEIEIGDRYRYRVVNDQIESAIAELEAIVGQHG